MAKDDDERSTEQITFRVTASVAKRLDTLAVLDRGANRPSRHDIARAIVLDRLTGRTAAPK